MSGYLLPLTQDSWQVMTLDVVIDGEEFHAQVEIRYLPAPDQWVVSIWDHSGSELLVNMIPLACSYGEVNDLLSPFRFLRNGKGLWNLAESDYLALWAAKNLSVRHDDAILAAGRVSDVYLRLVPEGRITEVVFAAGLGLWEAPVSLSVEAGVSVSDTVRRILLASGTGIPLLSFPGDDPVRSRAQAFYGRAAECVEEVMSAAGARGYLTESGLCVVPASGLPVSLELSSADLLSDPVFVGSGRMLLRTRITGWPLGKAVRVKWKDGSQEGLVLEDPWMRITWKGSGKVRYWLRRQVKFRVPESKAEPENMSGCRALATESGFYQFFQRPKQGLRLYRLGEMGI